MNMTAVALLMFRHARAQALIVESMAVVALGTTIGYLLGIRLTFHLLRVGVVAMREPHEPELSQTSGEADSRTRCVYRRLMTNDAHFASRVSEVFCVTLVARRVSGKYRRGVVRRAQMAERAVL